MLCMFLGQKPDCLGGSQEQKKFSMSKNFENFLTTHHDHFFTGTYLGKVWEKLGIILYILG